MTPMSATARITRARTAASRASAGAPSTCRTSSASGAASAAAAEAARRAPRSLLHSHVADQPPVDVEPRIEHQAVLGLLQLVQTEHDDDAGHQRGEGGVEGDAEAEGNAGDVPAQRSLRLLQGAADAAHRADE